MKILDCTLRDGGFKCDFNWDINFAKRYYNLMVKFNMPYIELGYWKQTAKSKKPFYNLNEKTLKYISSDINKPNISVIIDYHYCSKNLEDYPRKFETNIAMIRLTSRKEDIKKALIFSERLRSRTNLDISFQLINITNYSMKDIIQITKDVINFNPYYVYFADSHGNLNLFENYNTFSESIDFLRSNNVKIGFHLHNHTNRALMNFHICKKNQIDMIDTSILGLGKGGGNLRLEDIINNEYLLDLLNFIKKEKSFLHSSYNDRYLYDIITGRLSITDNYATEAKEKKLDLIDFYNKCLLIRGVDKDKYRKSIL